jgi:hypothetical protein
MRTEKKSSLNDFVNGQFGSLSREELKEIKGGWLYWQCCNGMTGQGSYYESWMCGDAGLCSIIYEDKE